MSNLGLEVASGRELLNGVRKGFEMTDKYDSSGIDLALKSPRISKCQTV